MYCQVFEVEGCGSFPLDMLRYDCAFPRGSEDVDVILQGDGAITPQDFAVRRTVKLARYTKLSTAQPTAARWISFGWKVVNVGKSIKV